MKISFTAKFPLLPHHSYCIEVSQLSPSVLPSEPVQEGLLCYQSERNEFLQFQPMAQMSESFKGGEALYLFLPFFQLWNKGWSRTPYWCLFITKDFSATSKNEGGWIDFEIRTQRLWWKSNKIYFFFIYYLRFFCANQVNIWTQEPGIFLCSTICRDLWSMITFTADQPRNGWGFLLCIL